MPHVLSQSRRARCEGGYAPNPAAISSRRSSSAKEATHPRSPAVAQPAEEAVSTCDIRTCHVHARRRANRRGSGAWVSATLDTGDCVDPEHPVMNVDTQLGIERIK